VIPRVIHQTWRGADLPAPFARLAETWRRHHPQWQWRLWTDTDNRAFVGAHFPAMLGLYDSYPHPIQRVDIVRYLILYVHGGLFIDLDFEALRPLDPHLTSDCVFGAEPAENCAVHGMDEIISNAFMAVRPGHPLLQTVITTLPEASHTARARGLDRNRAILETTGPFHLTRCLRAYVGADPATILPSDALYPLGISDIEALRRTGCSDALRAKLDRACAVHYHAGTWWRPSS
jgi:inositol phosphorylceramide mannosyltransferase catalytic subunit